MKRLTAKQLATALLTSFNETPAADQPQVVRNFIQALVRRRALRLLPRIVDHLQALQDSAAGVTRVQVWASGPIESRAIERTLEPSLGQTVVSVSTDPSLLGGLRLQIGDLVIDSSLRRRLQLLETHLSGTFYG